MVSVTKWYRNETPDSPWVMVTLPENSGATMSFTISWEPVRFEADPLPIIRGECEVVEVRDAQ